MRNPQRTALLKRCLACMLALAMIVTGVSWVPIKAEALSMSQYKSKMYDFIDDSRWKNGISWGDEQRPKLLSSWSSKGCYAYCCDFTNYVYNINNLSDGTKYSKISQICTGDVVHITNHYFVVLDRQGDNLYTAEGNFDDKVRIKKYGYKISGNTLYRINNSSTPAVTFINGWHYDESLSDDEEEEEDDSPEITDYEVTKVDSAGYNITCWVNEYVNDVSFLTWTDKDGKGDERDSGGENPKNGKWTVRVNISDHNNETGDYTTRIYADKKKGVWDRVDVHVTVPTYTSVFPLVDNGVYKLTNVLCGKAPAVSDSSTANSAQIVLQPYADGMNWKAIQHSDGYSFINTATGKALTVKDSSNKKDERMVQYDYTGSTAQRFKLVKQKKTSNQFALLAICSNMCVDVYSNNTKDGAPVMQYPYEEANEQHWKFELISSPEPEAPATYTVSYDANGGSGAPENQTKTHDTALTLSDTAPTRTGYTFTNWNTKADGSGTAYAAGAAYSDNADLTLYAQWQPTQAEDPTPGQNPTPGPEQTKYTVTFKDSDGKVIDTQTVEAGGTATAPTAPAKEGYTFERWDTDFSKVTSDLTVTAVYTQIQAEETTYTITYILNGGTNHPSNPASYSKGETVTLAEPTLAGKKFGGWFDSKGKQITSVSGESVTVTAKWQDTANPGRQDGELWIESIPDQPYTGKEIRPQIKVYNGQKLLQEKKDYTVAYKNNIAANNASSQSSAPTITITGMGNYTGKETAVFTITPKNIADMDVDVEDIYLAASDTVQNPVPEISWKGDPLKNNTDFTVEYPSNTGIYQDNGEYSIRVIGTGNFTGERTVKVFVTSAKLLNKAIVTGITSQKFTGQEIKPSFSVRYENLNLKEGQDYIVTHQNNVHAGVASVTLTGAGEYIGEKKVTYKITPASITGAAVSGMPKSVTFDSQLIYDLPCQLAVSLNGSKVTLEEGQDYEITFKNNTKVGTATAIFSGLNDYTGTLRRTFRITPYNIAADTENQIEVEEISEAPYAKNGAKVYPAVTCAGVTLVKGKDYTLSYKNNKKISTGSSKQPTVVITGIGNYKGKISRTFSVTEQDISLLSMTAADKVYKDKAGNYISVPVIKDPDGRTLQSGKDYEKVTYTDDSGAQIPSREQLPIGAEITVTALGKGNYTGEISCTYRITAATIAKAKCKAADQFYTGSEITLEKEDITVKVGKTTLDESEYEIIGYSNNIKKGTATVTIRGVGEYGGTKKINFKIKSRTLKWWQW